MKNIVKSVLSEAIGRFHFLRYRRYLQDGLTVFIYHDVTDNPSAFSSRFDLNVRPDIFDFQLRAIKEIFTVISADDLLAGNIPQRAAMITFDDGLESYFTTAVPILEKHGVPSLSFLNMATIRGEMMWAGVLTHLAADKNFQDFFRSKRGEFRTDRSLHVQIDHAMVTDYLEESRADLTAAVRNFVGPIADEEMVRKADANPLVFYGNHLYNHDVALLFSEQELLESFHKNRRLLQPFASTREIFSFPYGQPGKSFSMEQAELLHREGAKIVFYSSGRLNPAPTGPIFDRLPLSSFERTNNKIFFRIFRKSP